MKGFSRLHDFLLSQAYPGASKSPATSWRFPARVPGLVTTTVTILSLLPLGCFLKQRIVFYSEFGALAD